MPFTVEQLPGEPIVVVTYDASYFDFRKDPREIVKQLTVIANKTSERLAVIHDISEFSFTFANIVAGMDAAFRTEEGSPIQAISTDIYAVGGPEIVNLIIRGARQIQYGGHQISHFKTLEAAIQCARERSS